MIGQLDDLLKQGVDKSPFYQPILHLPATFSAADKTRLTAAYRAAIGEKIDGAVPVSEVRAAPASSVLRHTSGPKLNDRSAPAPVSSSW